MAHVITATDQNTIRRHGTGLRLSDPTQACPGYTLFAPLTGAGEVYLVDLAGNVAHEWKLPYPPGLHGYLATQEIVWQYMDDPPHNFFSWYISGAQCLPNSNTLITEGAFGRLFEVTPAGQTVWEYVNPHFGAFPPPWCATATPRGASAFTGEHNAVFRAFRYAAADLPALR